jgi:hypothetical protein
MNLFSRWILPIIILINIWTLTTLAQVSEDQDKIWSVVRLHTSNLQEPKIENNWVPAEQVSKFYDIQSGVTVGPNFRPKPGTNTTQSETSVDVHPTNNNIIFCSANSTNWPVTTLYGTGVYWSTNGSTTWTGYDNPPFGSNSGDPASVIGADGRFYENYINSSSGQGVAVSTNNGANWSTYTVAPNPGSLADKNHFMVDKKNSSPFVNRSYCGFTDFGGSNNYEVVLRYSTDYAATWSSSINLSGGLTTAYLSQGINIQTGPNGEVYAVWAVYIDGTVTTGEDGIGFAKSTNGGVTWSTPIYIYQQTNFGIRGNLSSKSGIRVSSFPSMAVDRSGGPYNGYIYVTWPQRGVSPAGSDPDIVYVKSTNGGTTWSSPVRVNDDPLNNGKDQYYPWCTVDQATGQFMIVFYDSRDVANTQANVYMARSLDGGSTFENFKVSDQAHTPAPISGLASGYAGDYIGVAAYNNVAYPYWGDNRTGNYQGWMAKVTFGPPCPVAAPSNPNPANGATNISANLAQLAWTNGSGATKCEVWFGASGSLSKVYDGNLVSSYNIPSTLSYNTTYNWQIVDKNDTCGTTGSIWAFTTELSPGIVFMENFNNLNCWSAIGPLGTTNWSTQSTANAGGTAPELRLNWSPQFNGLSKLVSCSISALNNRHYTVTLKHMIDWYANPAPTLGLGVSYDNGSTYTSVWSITPTSDVGPQTIQASFTTPTSDSPDAINMYLVLYCNGNSYNINYWYIDDITVNDDDYTSLANPGGVTATPLSSSQIDVAFTPNVNNNNVVVVWNLTGTFTTPTGVPPAIGQPFAGGTLLYNGTVSPVHHTGLNPVTTYYYKLFSYNGTIYSPGVNASATTLNIADPTNETATPISNSQINVSFIPNPNSNNVVVVWNLTGTFTTPTGVPPAIGQPFAGGTLLYNGITSPVQHTGLNPVTTYYYKLFSYFAGYYSPGVNAAATTLSLLDFGVNLLVNDNCSNSVQLYFGTAPGATDCYDPGLDVEAPPPPPVGAFDARFQSCNYAWFTDIRGSNTSGERIWDIYYTPANGCEPVSFTWNPSQLPANGYFHLVDPVYGNLVNVNMRLRNNYTDLTGLGHLQIKYNYQICSNFNVSGGWNMISLPLEVSDNNYLVLFPNAVTGTLFGYSGLYYNTQTINTCTGYWLKFPSSQIVQVCGLDRTNCSIGLTSGWNLIGGPDCNVPLNNIGDPGGIIIPGTLYGYSGSYITATSVDGTKAYWIKTSAPGTITISCGAELPNNLNTKLEISESVIADFGKIEVSDVSNNKQILYFNSQLDKNVSIESFSMPPLPPAGSFDVRFMGDYRLSESDEVTIKIQANDYPISLLVSNLYEKNEIKYIIQEMVGNSVVNSHPMVEGEKIFITNKDVSLLKITRQQDIPTSYNLEQNFPNPFNPSTTIKFSLPEAADVNLSIFNALGQKVAELVNSNLEAGRYTYQWDAGNIASGIYIFQLRSDKFVSVKKMLLLK